jgi:hypothetical protein
MVGSLSFLILLLGCLIVLVAIAALVYLFLRERDA